MRAARAPNSMVHNEVAQVHPTQHAIFFSMSFVHVTRSANEVAHMLIRSGEQSAYLVLCHCISGCIQEIGYSDLLTE